MQITPELMRFALLLCMLAMLFLAAFYLRQRRLAPLEYAIWGLSAILIPLIGPFFVIWIRPGSQRYQTQN